VLQEVSETCRDGAKRANPETRAAAGDFSKQDGENMKQRVWPKEWPALRSLKNNPVRQFSQKLGDIHALLPPTANDFFVG